MEKQDQQSDNIENPNNLKYYEFTEQMKQKAEQVLVDDIQVKSEFWYNKFEKDQQRNWDIFYRENKNNFFKDRQYIEKEFQELMECDSQKIYLEYGCGVGNAIFPLLKKFNNLIFYGFDFSKNAIQCILDSENYRNNEDRIIVKVADLVVDEIPMEMESPDFSSLIFVLCAISPENHIKVMTKIYNHMKTGSLLFFRDYAKYDQAQIKFAQKKSHKLKDNFYVKSDGTRCFYFTTEYCQELFEQVGFKVLENRYHQRVISNKKKELEMYRVWIQSKIQKP